MECSLPFVMMPNKSVVEKCSTMNFYVVFTIASILIIIVSLSYFMQKKKMQDMKTTKKPYSNLTYAVSITAVDIVVLILLWYFLRFLIVNGSVSSWESYQAQVNTLVKSGMRRDAALQAVQNQVNTRNLEYDILETSGQRGFP